MLNKINEIILTAGPTISAKEIEYVTDAVIHGWNHHHSDYIKKFEQAFADYIGVKYAMATSSCTGALHLALLAMGVGPGDEVIVPDITWIATVSAVVYVGAKPVFADIEPDTWVMNPDSVAKLITQKTKAIIPVHLYGNPVDMDPLIKLAEQHGLDILEDAAPAIGTEYKGKKTGSFGRVAVVSFQGAKALVTGEGGMLITNDYELMERARIIGDHGRDPNRAFYNNQIGYKYKMSNIQGALGLAQIERVEEIVSKKRTIFKWYEERLKDVPNIKLNVERPGTKSLYWMSSLILGEELGISRNEFMHQLKERNIDTRPFFYQVSSFDMFKHYKVNNPVAYSIAPRGVNLPSGHERKEEEIDYICAHIKDVLKQKQTRVNSVQPHGWLAYRDFVQNTLKEIKNPSNEKADEFSILLTKDNKEIGKLRPVIAETASNLELITTLANWRKEAQVWFPSQFNVTVEGTKKWMENQVTGQKDRIFFWVEDCEKKYVGHVGLFRFNYIDKYCEIDNIVRGEASKFPGAMTYACSALIDWAFEKLGLETVCLRVLSDNKAALALYGRLGFMETQRTPLMKVVENDAVRWIDVIGQPYLDVEKYFVTMKLNKKVWRKGK